MGELTILKAALLGLVQGLTEFLPISSSGHLVIFQHLFGLESGNGELIPFDVMLHFGTLVAVVAVFYRDIFEMLKGRKKHLILLLVVATLPAVAIGLPFKDFIESGFGSLLFVGFSLIFTGIILWLTQYAYLPNRPNVSIWHSFLIGCAQAVAILPGVSRSGSTISMALFLRIEPQQAARFSFLMLLPAVSGAVILNLSSLSHMHADKWMPYAVGTLVSALTGYLAIRWMLRLVQRGQFRWFGLYCAIIGAVTVTHHFT